MFFLYNTIVLKIYIYEYIIFI
eukprot:UN09307